MLAWLQRIRGTGILDASKWRVALTGGEPIPNVLVREFRRLDRPQLALYGFYGPAEIIICSATAEIRYRDASDTEDGYGVHRTPLKTLPNYSTYIVDEKLRVLPLGVPGEIVTGGGVAKGYLNNPGETMAQFVVDKHASAFARSRGWITMHRSGDRGRMTRDGGLLIEGRIAGDTQVKIGGIRMDLLDIEANIIRNNPSIDLAIVSARKMDACSFLAAFIVFSPECTTAERSVLLQELPRTLPLPQYMRPSVFVEMDSDNVPKTSSGKIDRAAMQQEPLPESSNDNYSPALAQDVHGETLTTAEENLKKLWLEAMPSGVVSHHTITKQSDFFHAGGNSLALINLQALVKDSLNVSVPLYRLFAASTLSSMAAIILGPDEPGNVGGQATTVDWAEEAKVPGDVLVSGGQQPQAGSLGVTRQPEPPRRPPSVILLTGATGFVGRETLRRLVSNDSVAKLHCLAVRKPLAQLPSSLFGHAKVVVHRGDLGAPRLGLGSEAEAAALFADADAVIHNGANVSFMKTYETLRPTNVGSTKELVRLALPRRLPFHFISSASVVTRLVAGKAGGGDRSEEMVHSVASHPPPAAAGSASASPVDGYVSAKWVGEVYLERVSAAAGLPVCIHRPSAIVGDGASELDLMSNMVRYAGIIRAVPDLNMRNGGAWGPSLDFVRIENVAAKIVSEVMELSQTDVGETAGV